MRALVLVAVLCGTAGAQVEDFRAGRREVAGLLERQSWSAARERLTALLDEHAGEDYVLLELADIVDDFRRCAFWSEYEEPDPDDLIAGELVSWNARTGKIKLRYSAKLEEKKRARKGKKAPEVERKSTGVEALDELLAASQVTTGYRPGDFENVSGLFVHPVHFSGPFTIEIRGGPQGSGASSSFLTPSTSVSPVIVAGIGEEQAILAELLLAGTPENLEARVRQHLAQ